jgi:hypothetical protein
LPFPKKIVSLQLKRFKDSKIMNVAINSNIYQQASDYAQSQGLNLSDVIENFLVRFIGKSKATETEQQVPDIVLSLLGAGESVAEDDLNAREAYNKYLEEKYQ